MLRPFPSISLIAKPGAIPARPLSRVMAILILLLGCCAFLSSSPSWGQNAFHKSMLDPLSPPSTLPQDPPPLLVPGPLAPLPEKMGSPIHTIKAIKGWQIINFPLGKITAVKGLQYKLLFKGSTGIEFLDPVNFPAKLDPGLAYIAYFSQPATVTFTGQVHDGKNYQKTRLHMGWNILGSPGNKAFEKSHFTVTKPGDTTARLEDACSNASENSDSWLYSRAYTYLQGQWQAIDLTQPGSLNRPLQVVALFSWTEVALNWNVVSPSSGLPKIGSISPEPASPGDKVVIKGQYLGQAKQGTLTLNNKPVPKENILSWTPSMVKFTVPAQATTGRVGLMVDRYPANALSFKVSAPPVNRNYPDLPNTDSQTGSLIGEVVSSQGKPLAQAQIQLESGPGAVTDSQGKFELRNVPPQNTMALISLPGYKSAKGQVHIVAGQTRTLKVSLRPEGSQASAGSQEQGTFYVVGKPLRVGPRDRRFWVYRIEVTEDGNISKRWSDTWWEDHDDSSYELRCSNATVGRTYNIYVTWKNRRGRERTNKFSQKFTRAGQSFIYDSPTDY